MGLGWLGGDSQVWGRAVLELVAGEGGGMWRCYEQQAGGAVQSPAVRFVLPMSFCSSFVHVQLTSLGVGPYSSLAAPRHCSSPSPCSGTGRMEEGEESLSGTEVLSAFVSLMQWIERSSISPANPGTGYVVPHW